MLSETASDATSITDEHSVISIGTDQDDPLPSASTPATKLATELANMVQRPNTHVALHFAQTVEEYASLRNCMVLMGESKHKIFKRLVTKSNFREVELFLLQKENVNMTTRLALGGAFANTHPACTTLLRNIFRLCPLLYKSILPAADLSPDMINGDDNDDDDDELDIVDDESHKAIHTWSKLKTAECRAANLPSGIQYLDEMDTFRSRLLDAYNTDYGVQNIYLSGRTGRGLRWWRNISFYDPKEQRRVTHRVGDVVCVLDKSPNKFAILTGILTHSIGSSPRAFLQVKLLEKLSSGYGCNDLVLGLNYYQKTSRVVMLGMPLLGEEKDVFWMLQVRHTTNGWRRDIESDLLLHCDWNLRFM